MNSLMRKITLKCIQVDKEIYRNFNDRINDFIYFLNGKKLESEQGQPFYISPTFEFRHGYDGNGPGQLAYAICTELYGQAMAEEIYLDFKRSYIIPLPFDTEFNKELFVPRNPMAYWGISKINQNYSKQTRLF